ncbi:hypothetical protein HY256_12340 [Candidatus Sumerlaeota bacterium]|nr:hypothetical protein [Candidatus Sumerlaeota bacterium]
MGRPVAEQPIEGKFPSGTILAIDDEELVIYRRPVAGQPYDMVYSLLFDGTVKIEAVELGKHQVFEMGCLPPNEFKTLQTRMKWNKALVAVGCRNREDAERIPEPTGAAALTPIPPTVTPPSPTDRIASTPRGGVVNNLTRGETVARADQPQESKKIRRGQRITLKFGDKSWEAVYWGRDQKGPVVAHNTHRRWSLMHLDLNRFKESMIADSDPDPHLVEEIMRDLSTQIQEY